MEKTLFDNDSAFTEQKVKVKKTRDEVFNDYDGFVDKFKPKLTTDDCYTPPAVYDCVLKWVNDNIQPLDGLTIRRPFKPGGDYQKEAEEYGENDVVIDNPPFSILAKIQRYYATHGIRYFLFAPGLTLFSARDIPNVTYIITSAQVIYENGANVCTSFVTNMEGRHRIVVAGDLNRLLKDVQDKAKEIDTMKKWDYPDNVITAARTNKIATRGICFKVPFEDCVECRKLDNQNGELFGGGYLLSEKAAAEKAAAEKAAAEKVSYNIVRLSERELSIIRGLGSRDVDDAG